jgi:hypothetical protein
MHTLLQRLFPSWAHNNTLGHNSKSLDVLKKFLAKKQANNLSFVEIRDILLDVLIKEQERRADNDEILENYEIAWQRDERDTMYQAVNLLREKLGKRALELHDIMQVESTASGHIDYSSKFALYCAELVCKD